MVENQNLLQVGLAGVYNGMVELDPSRVSFFSDDYDRFCHEIEVRFSNVQVLVAAMLEPPQLPGASPLPSIESQMIKHTSPSISTSHLPRLEHLKFSGRVEEWPEFKRNWISQFRRLVNDTQLQYLKPALPPKDRAKVSAVTTMDMCWTRLGKVYGDRQVNLSTVRSNQRALTLKGVQKWERLMELHDEVEKAVDQLLVINASSELKGDYDLVSVLINKLHISYQEEWDEYVVEGKENDIPIWDKFTAFLEIRNE